MNKKLITLFLLATTWFVSLTVEAQTKKPRGHLPELMNQERLDQGLALLMEDLELKEKANYWSYELASSETFYHSDMPYGEIIQRTPNYHNADNFMYSIYVNSPEHYAVITSADWTGFGIATWESSGGDLYNVMLFR